MTYRTLCEELEQILSDLYSYRNLDQQLDPDDPALEALGTVFIERASNEQGKIK